MSNDIVGFTHEDIEKLILPIRNAGFELTEKKYEAFEGIGVFFVVQLYVPKEEIYRRNKYDPKEIISKISRGLAWKSFRTMDEKLVAMGLPEMAYLLSPQLYGLEDGRAVVEILLENLPKTKFEVFYNSDSPEGYLHSLALVEGFLPPEQFIAIKDKLNPEFMKAMIGEIAKDPEVRGALQQSVGRVFAKEFHFGSGKS